MEIGVVEVWWRCSKDPTEICVVASGGGGASNKDKVKRKALGLGCNL